MKQFLLVVLCIALTACGTSSTLRGDQETDYILGSYSKAGGVVKLIQGSTSACKVTLHGMDEVAVELTFDADGCSIEAVQ